MFFSEWFGIDSDLIKGYGAVDISLVCDVPLFVDPMLIFNSENEIYKKLHKSIIRYFHFLYTKASQGLTPKEINAWFNFSEVPNNWLGYSLVGNKGNALGKNMQIFCIRTYLLLLIHTVYLNHNTLRKLCFFMMVAERTKLVT